MVSPTYPTDISVGTTQTTTLENIYRTYDKPTIDFINMVLQSAFIPNTKILSALLITLPSLGKTTYLELTQFLDFVHYTNDVSPKPLFEFLDEVDKGRKKFLVIPDFINTLSHSKNTVDNTRSIMRSMIEEGFTSSDFYGMQREYDKPVKAGMLSGITVDKANENTGKWRSDGFYSRLLPWSYSHSQVTSENIINDKLNGERPIKKVKFVINRSPVEPSINELMKEKIKNLAYQITQDKYVGSVYRPLEQILALCKSSAVIRNSDSIEQIDIDNVLVSANWINRKQNPL